MPTMNIKDPEVHRLARVLAHRRGTTATGAVRQALQEALERADGDVAERAKRLLAIGERSRQRGGTVRSDADLYDEHGLPR